MRLNIKAVFCKMTVKSKAMLKPFLTALAIAGLYGCASTNAPLGAADKASLNLSKALGTGTAVAFQLDAPSCESGGFNLTPRGDDGSFGQTVNLKFVNVLFGFQPNNLNGQYLNIDKAGKYKLHAKFLPAGTYLLNGPICRRSKKPFIVTGRQGVRSFEFNVVAGKTNYIGNIRIQRNLDGLKWSVIDDIEVAEEDYQKRYAAKGAGPVHSAIAKVITTDAK